MNKKLSLVFFSLLYSVISLAANDNLKDSLEVRKAVSNSPAELLRGEISGVRVSNIDGSPNGSVNTNIRGLNTLRGDSQPLWIVDGVVIGSSIHQNLNAFYLSGGVDASGTELPDYTGKSYSAPLGNFRWLNLYDIESIEVLKDLSATALYGMQGANGVIIIKTKRTAENSRNINIRANAGIDLGFQASLKQRYSIGLNGNIGSNSYYNISAFINSDKQHKSSTNAALTLNFETMANSVFKFGLNSFLSYGNLNSSSGTNYIGSPSAMMIARYPKAFPNDNYQGSYDDGANDYRSVNSAWLQINFLPGLNLKLTGGIDYQHQTRFFWYGDGTSFGRENSGASGILSNSLFNYNLLADLNFQRHIAVKHKIQAGLIANINGYKNIYNALCGTDFDLPFLRGKGLSSSGSKHAINRFARDYNLMGAAASLAYEFDSIAGFNALVRVDKGYTLNIFPSAEAFVDIKKLVLKNNSFISSLKLKGGYGEAGRETAMPYEYISNYIKTVPEAIKGTEHYYDGVNTLISKEYNAGFELGFVDNRFIIGAKYYNKNTNDIFRVYNFGKNIGGLYDRVPNPKTEQELSNQISNKGLEINANLELIKADRLSWSVYSNLAYNTNTEFTTIPKIFGGFGTALKVSDLTLQAKFSGAAQFDIINANKIIETGNVVKERGDYLRLDCLSLSYQFKSIKAMSIDLAGYNLLTITKYSGWNVDVNSFGIRAITQGIDYGSYPLYKSIVLGIKLKF